MALLAIQQMAITGTTVTFAAATGGGDTAPADDRSWLEVKNTDSSSHTVTVVVPGTLYGQALADVTATVAATTGHVRLGPLVPGLADPTTGLISITYSAATGMTVALVRC